MQSTPRFRERNVHLHALHAFSPVLRVHPHSARTDSRSFVADYRVGERTSVHTRAPVCAPTRSRRHRASLRNHPSLPGVTERKSPLCRAAALRSSRTTRASEERGTDLVAAPTRPRTRFSPSRYATAIIQGEREEEKEGYECTKGNISSADRPHQEDCARSTFCSSRDTTRLGAPIARDTRAREPVDSFIAYV